MIELTELIERAATISGIPLEVLTAKGRKQEVVYCRAAIAIIALRHGWKHKTIAQMIGVHRTSVFHLAMMQDKWPVRDLVARIEGRNAVSPDLLAQKRPKHGYSRFMNEQELREYALNELGMTLAEFRKARADTLVFPTYPQRRISI